MKTIFLLFFSLMCSQLNAQEQPKRNEFRGEFTLGLRSTSSFFDNTYTGLPGLGTGGGFKIRLGNRINTDWFADYIVGATSYVKRTDSHIGWSVLYYPFNYQNKGLKPFISAGHCFDYTRNSDLTDFSNFANRWSSAIQGGVGFHYYFTEKLDVVLQAQYMMHIGTHLETEIVNSQVVFSEEKGTLEEGHLLVTVGINFTLGKLWGK
jgi:hypothetical protein